MQQAHDEFDGYFLWLCGLIDANLDRYSELCYRLHTTDFVWCLDKDSARASDGLKLREKYYYETDCVEDWVVFMEESCTVLEALIGIAQRMNFLLEDENSTDMTRVYFWEFVENLGLKTCSNIKFMEPKMAEETFGKIDSAINIWLNRCFEPDGFGSIFPLEQPSCDQRNEPIFYQMNQYAIEKYVG